MWADLSLLWIALLIAIIFLPLIWLATRQRARRRAGREAVTAEEGRRWLVSLAFFVALLVVAWIIGVLLV